MTIHTHIVLQCDQCNAQLNTLRHSHRGATDFARHKCGWTINGDAPDGDDDSWVYHYCAGCTRTIERLKRGPQ